jgi:hypothetical protein
MSLLGSEGADSALSCRSISPEPLGRAQQHRRQPDRLPSNSSEYVEILARIAAVPG